MAAINLEISEGQIKNAIAIAVAESFTDEKRDRLLRDVIRAHLEQKESGYDKETLLSKRIGEIVRSIATEEIHQRLEELRPRIRQILRSWMGKDWEDRLLGEINASLNRVVPRNIRVDMDFNSIEGDE